MLKKIFVLALCIIMACTAAACQNIGNVIGEKIVETVLGKKIEIKGELYTVTHADGMKYLYSNGKWPGVSIAKLIPAPGVGIVVRTLYTCDSCVITIDNITENDYNKYLKKTVAAGYNHKIERSEGDNEHGFSAKNNAGSELSLCYNTDSETLFITLLLNNGMKSVTIA